jgi:hypothetical protein
VSHLGFVSPLRARQAGAALVASALLGLGGCLWTGKEAVDHPSPTIGGTKFKVIATIAGGASRNEIRMSATVRKELSDSGWKGVARAGRWDTPSQAVKEICEPGDVDGVLFVSYNRLELMDCTSHQMAWSVEGAPERGAGMQEMTKRLFHYLRGQAAAPADH